jgi:hypothetical protein
VFARGGTYVSACDLEQHDALGRAIGEGGGPGSQGRGPVFARRARTCQRVIWRSKMLARPAPHKREGMRVNPRGNRPRESHGPLNRSPKQPQGPAWLNAVHATAPEKVVAFIITPVLAAGGHLPALFHRPAHPLSASASSGATKMRFCKNAFREEADYLADCTVREVMVLPPDSHAYWPV